MIARVTRGRTDLVEIPQIEPEIDPEPVQAPLLSTLWRRRWTVILTTLLCVGCALAYVMTATPIYTSTSTVNVEQAGTKILSEGSELGAKSDAFLFTQADVLKSAPILSSALGKLDVKHMKTFEGMDDPIDWLQTEKNFQVEVGKKNDVITVSLDSPYPQEAAAIVNKVVDAYIALQSQRVKSNAAEVLKVLQKDMHDREAQLEAQMRDMLQFAQRNSAVSFPAVKGNPVLDRLSVLCTTLANAELETFKVKTELKTAREILADAALTHKYVVASEAKGKDSAASEMSLLRADLERYRMALSTAAQTNGASSEPVSVLQANVAALSADIARKEKEIAEAHVTETVQRLTEAQAREDDNRRAFLAQQKEAVDLNTKAADYARMDVAIQRMQKQCDLLDTRMMEVAINSQEAGTLNVQLVEAARAPKKPTKPRKVLTLAAALLAGLVFGSGLGLTRDWLDQRLRSADEVTAALGLPILGVVPHMRGRQSFAARGQHVCVESTSNVAEAYRTVRTAVYFGAPRGAKTILVTSPSTGDGRSTTASNLALTMAQSGHRTLLLDADFRKPLQHKIFEIEPAAGVSDVLAAQAKLRDAIHVHRANGVSRLDLLPCGSAPADLSEILTQKRFAQVLEVLSRAYDRIIIDSPPLMSVSDARILAASADVSLLVVRVNKSNRKPSVLALQGLRNVGANVLGVIINDMPRDREAYGWDGGRGRQGAFPGRPLRALDETTVAVDTADGADGSQPEVLGQTLRLAGTARAGQPPDDDRADPVAADVG